MWKAVVKGQPRARQTARMAQPSGPSVAMWTAVGAKASAMRASAARGRSASLISG